MLSTLSVIKIVDHAIRSKEREVCGYMTGFSKDGVFYVVDASELPLIGETSREEISARLGSNAYEYTTTILDLGSAVYTQ